MERIDDAVRRILKMKFELNLFNNPYDKSEDYPLFSSVEFRKIGIRDCNRSYYFVEKHKQIFFPFENKKSAGVRPECQFDANTQWGLVLFIGWAIKAEQFTENTIRFSKRSAMKWAKNVSYAPGVSYVEGGKYWEEKSEHQWSCKKAKKQII